VDSAGSQSNFYSLPVLFQFLPRHPPDGFLQSGSSLFFLPPHAGIVFLLVLSTAKCVGAVYLHCPGSLFPYFKQIWPQCYKIFPVSALDSVVWLLLAFVTFCRNLFFVVPSPILFLSLSLGMQVVTSLLPPHPFPRNTLLSFPITRTVLDHQ